MDQTGILKSSKIKHIHFVGIGGISMSGLAEILLNLGYKITGSEIKYSNLTKKLEDLGVKINYFHAKENIQNPDLVVYTAAVKSDNPEIQESTEKGIPLIERAVLLGEIMRMYPKSIAISGTHGKTTTTSMISMIMIESRYNPTVHLGGELDAINGNTRIGGNEYFITEACEYVESFLKFYPYLAIILNIEADHLDYYKDIEHIKNSFLKFALLIPKDGYIIINSDDKNTMDILEHVNCNVVTFSLASENCMWSVRDIVFDSSGYASFTVTYNKNELAEIKLSVPGIHNVYNALSAIASCYTLGCKIEDISTALAKFTGTHRRFELKGVVNNIKVIDDYAHHPSEIIATLSAARNTKCSKIWCVFQPHTYTRTRLLLEDFAKSFGDADNVILADIYAAREANTNDIHSSMLEKKISEHNKKAIYFSTFDQIVDYLKDNVQTNDIVITMGAGDIYKVGEMFLEKMLQL